MDQVFSPIPRCNQWRRIGLGGLGRRVERSNTVVPAWTGAHHLGDGRRRGASMGQEGIGRRGKLLRILIHGVVAQIILLGRRV